MTPTTPTRTPLARRFPPPGSVPPGPPPSHSARTPAPPSHSGRTPAPPSRPSGAPAPVSAPAPRIGGFIPGDGGQEAWTGGSNLPSRKSFFPLFLQQRRPLKYSNARAFELTCDAGMEWKLPDTGETSDVTLTFWFENLAASLDTLGLDTVFRIPAPDFSSEISLAEDWGQNKAAIVSPWVDSLKNGLPGLPACHCDLQNLAMSRNFVLASLTKKLRMEIIGCTGRFATGPDILVAVIDRKMTLVLSVQRDLVQHLQTFCITMEPGEDVDKLNPKIKNICIKIGQSGPEPQDLAQIVTAIFTKSQVEMFRLKLCTMSRELDTNHSQYNWKQVLTIASTEYHALKKLWIPQGKTQDSVLKTEFQNHIAQLNTRLNALTIKNTSDTRSSNPGVSSSSGGPPPTFEKKCHDCGKLDVYVRHDGCPSVGSGKFRPHGWEPKSRPSRPLPPPPPSGAKSTPVNIYRDHEGSKEVRCDKCNRWWKIDDPKSHSTAEHGKGPHTSGPHVPSGPHANHQTVILPTLIQSLPISTSVPSAISSLEPVPHPGTTVTPNAIPHGNLTMHPGMMHVIEDGVVDFGPPINFCDCDEPEVFFNAASEVDQLHVQHLLHGDMNPVPPVSFEFDDDEIWHDCFSHHPTQTTHSLPLCPSFAGVTTNDMPQMLLFFATCFLTFLDPNSLTILVVILELVTMSRPLGAGFKFQCQIIKSHFTSYLSHGPCISQ